MKWHTHRIVLRIRLPEPLGDASHPLPLLEKFDAFFSLHGGLDEIFLSATRVVGSIGGVRGCGHLGIEEVRICKHGR